MQFNFFMISSFGVLFKKPLPIPSHQDIFIYFLQKTLLFYPLWNTGEKI